MRKANVTILASIIAMALVASVVSVGTMAWFSTVPEETDTYTMNAAEMKMEVITSPVTFSNLIPGQDFGPVLIKIEKKGTIDIVYLGCYLIINDSIGTP